MGLTDSVAFLKASNLKASGYRRQTVSNAEARRTWYQVLKQRLSAWCKEKPPRGDVVKRLPPPPGAPPGGFLVEYEQRVLTLS